MYTSIYKQINLADEMARCWLKQIASGTKNETLSFKGKSIYSYHWWEIARITEMKTESGKRIVLSRRTGVTRTSDEHLWRVSYLARRRDDLFILRLDIPPEKERIPKLKREQIIELLKTKIDTLSKSRVSVYFGRPIREIKEIAAELKELGEEVNVEEKTARLRVRKILKQL